MSKKKTEERLDEEAEIAEEEGKEVIASGTKRLPTKGEQDRLVYVVRDELGLGFSPAIKILRHRQQFEEETIELMREFKGLPFPDSALAISKSMKMTFHWAAAAWTEGTFFSKAHPPRIIQVDCGPNGEKIGVPIGNFQIPMLEDAMCNVGQSRDGSCFFSVTIKRKFSEKMEEMLTLAEKLARAESLYRGKALRFTMEEDAEGKLQPIITFMKLGEEETLILPRQAEVHMQANLWTPIQQPEAAAALGIPIKRALLLYGRYGVGKTLAAHRTAHIALEFERTFIYVDDAHYLSEAYLFADQVSPAVLFVEDIDRVTSNKGSLATLANVLDGVTSKGAGVYLVATTNHIDKIPPILLRPGRFDMHLELTVPDEPAIRALIELYAPQIEGDVETAVKLLEGHIPAIIRECCERAKLYSLTRGAGDITGQDLADAVDGMGKEMERIAIANAPPAELSNGDRLAEAMHDVVHNGSGKVKGSAVKA